MNAWRWIVTASLLGASVCHAQEAGTRPRNVLEETAKASFQKASDVLKDKGMPGLIEAIKACYANTSPPAFACIGMDISGSVIADRGAHDPEGQKLTGDFFSKSNIDARTSYQYRALEATDEQALYDIGVTRQVAQMQLVEAEEMYSQVPPILCNSDFARSYMLESVAHQLFIAKDKIASIATLGGSGGNGGAHGNPGDAEYSSQIRCPIRVTLVTGGQKFLTYDERYSKLYGEEVRFFGFLGSVNDPQLHWIDTNFR